ncbi:hypothetical protein M422DRAFT_240321 [Sphaerobolus stellatus SS14]|nr:hypothetical protein M422DRAFT_240321 [Sphaerobolus stellatus SS14]
MWYKIPYELRVLTIEYSFLLVKAATRGGMGEQQAQQKGSLEASRLSLILMEWATIISKIRFEHILTRNMKYTQGFRRWVSKNRVERLECRLLIKRLTLNLEPPRSLPGRLVPDLDVPSDESDPEDPPGMVFLDDLFDVWEMEYAKAHKIAPKKLPRILQNFAI